MSDAIIWIGIAFCVTQSAIFSGLNLAFFSLTRLRLEIEAKASSATAAKNVLKMRQDSNFLLTTILWGNVGINVLLTLLSDSVLLGFSSFMFSTFIITFFGEIIPQAYFSRNALKMASLLTPVLKFYQILLYPVAKPSALLLNVWLGKESTQYFSEKNLRLFIEKHIEEDGTEIDHVEGVGALNFFSLDDLHVNQEGEKVNPKSLIKVETENGKVLFPDFEQTSTDPFVQLINQSEEKWIIFVDEKDKPVLTLDSDGFLRSVLLNHKLETQIEEYCHIPVIIDDLSKNLGDLLMNFKQSAGKHSDKPIDQDIVLVWTEDDKRIITGADILGRLLKGI